MTFKLPPLPDPVDTVELYRRVSDVYDPQQMKEYALAAIAPIAAENAKLRATCEEVEQKRNMQEQEQEPVAWQVHPGETLIAATGLDDLMYWLDRCEDKGHLENCADLIEPWANFSYRKFPSTPHPAPAQQPVTNQSPSPEYDRGFSDGWDRGHAHGIAQKGTT